MLDSVPSLAINGTSHCIPSVGHHWQCISAQPPPPAPIPENVLTVLIESQTQPEFTGGAEARCWAAHVARSVGPVPASCVELLVPASGESSGNTHTCRLGGPIGSAARRAGSKRYEWFLTYFITTPSSLTNVSASKLIRIFYTGLDNSQSSSLDAIPRRYLVHATFSRHLDDASA